MDELKVNVYAEVKPSEDSFKVLQAAKNLFPKIEFAVSNEKVEGKGKGKELLIPLKNKIKDKQAQGVLKRLLNENKSNNLTWVYLNKQAAIAGHIALCEEERESPLGPIKLEIVCDDIDELIKWLSGG
jgi:hypothetical protein